MNKLIEAKVPGDQLVDVKKPCILLKKLLSLSSYGKGTVQRNWVEERINKTILKLEIFDDVTVNMIIERSDELGMDSAKQLFVTPIS